MVKKPPASAEGFLGLEDPLEKETATHSSVLPWELHGQRGAWRVIVHEVAKNPTQLSD